MADKKYKYGIIGVGNMGYAILKGLLKTTAPSSVTFYEKNRERAEDVAASTGAEPADDNAACAALSQYIVLAVKPYQLDAAIAQMRDAVTSEQIIISIAPGITIASLREKVGKPCRIVRAMPNTPALIGEGMTGVCYDEADFSNEEKETIKEFFSSFGKMEIVDESLMDAVVCVSGSSPAYVYMFIDALADSAVMYGIPRQTAIEMAAQAVMGSAKMVLETGMHPSVLKDQVCSPGGTTIAAVGALEEYGFRNAILKAGERCYKKCTEM